MELSEIISAVFSFLFMSLAGLVSWIHKSTQKSNQKNFDKNEIRFDKNEARMDNIEENYLTRFEKLNQNLNMTEKNIIEEITKSRHDFRDSLYKVQLYSEQEFQKQDSCLVHGQEIKEMKIQLEDVKKMLMK